MNTITTMRYYSIHIIAASLLLLMISSSVSSGAVNQSDVGVSDGDTFSLKVVKMDGIFAEYKDEVLTLENYELHLNETIGFTVTDATLDNDSVAAEVSTLNGTHDLMIPLGFFGSPIIHTNWDLWSSEVETLKTVVEELLPELNNQSMLPVDIPDMTITSEITQGDKLVTATVLGEDGAGSSISITISYKKATGVLNQVLLYLRLKTDVVEIPGTLSIENTDFVEPGTDDAVPGFGILLAFTSLFVLIPLIRKRK